ncbi:methyl-accepting chemotaxis protein [Agrobacterium tumefaciens]|uniref:methyl-accepting chemotaxis protein n=1 Tax=Agrobacterium tumefaciens TaxID=358 RepID=UPI001571F47E|nr:methyl-accepting chemotaxis protein [Agrobacterium tumefaciens]MEA1844617.1 methyl-accepting chemotaxis protein [Agrobacterium tumefaciens]NTA45347.1 PAS domain-containing protein [Agrobacterium tumefaciens]WCK21937.1 methyl-accepting chemotaxis protein [Agrobacterium tumefaciens]WIE35796.1 methyl-accepting chemotaxis protein [Agrobacterium tumefaciens]
MFGSSKISRMQTMSLNSITANIMIADADLNIRYMNEAVTALLKEAETDLKKELPRFDFGKLVGSNIDIFHKNPSHQRNMLAALKAQHRATIWVGHRAFDLIVTPLLEGTKTTGFVVEWANAKERLQNVDFQGQMVAISRVQGIIEFTTEGEIITANANFLKAIDYRLDEIKGRSHSILVDPEYARTPAYKEFWDALRRGEFQAAEFTRFGKNGKRVVINASYNPILDSKGKVTKVVKFATDVTERVHAVNTIAEALNKLAQGDLSFCVDRPFAPDFEGLRNTMNDAISQMRDTLSDVARSTDQIDTGTREISQSAEDLSKRTEQQAASLEETAAALDQITVNVSNAAKRAEEARHAAATASGNAERSGKVVADAVGAMSRIESSSNQISNIIGVIDEIAFQTNLLALNAGVEAARAGEAGKGFAVVAQEVRELAQRSAQAAKEIKGLIRNSSEEVSTGVKLVSDTGEALRTIQQNIVAVNDHMEAITSSAKEQATGLSEVNSAVNQMDQVTQQNAAMVEETNAASATLAQETARLRDLIEMFQLGGPASRASLRGANHSSDNTSNRKLELAQPGHRPVPSPARQLITRMTGRVSGGAVPDNWQEF